MKRLSNRRSVGKSYSLMEKG